MYPYLPLSERLSIGPWTLIPIGDVRDEDAISADAAEAARGVHALYRMSGDRRRFGAVIRGNDPVGAEQDGNGLGLLRLAIVTAMLDRNPSLADPDADDLNAGHRICTSENAYLAGHGVDDDGYTGYARGTISQMLVGGAKVGESVDVIDPPAELMLPLFRPQIDDVYVVALYDVLANLDEQSPDLPGAIRWLEVGWVNSRTVTAHTHVMALRAGFDVLFGGSSTTDIRTRLSALLDEAGAPRRPHEWDDHNGRHYGPFDLTDLEWWFQSFALLRNAIAHGGVIANEAWDFEGVPHIWHAERNLRRAIKKIVADAGHEDVLLDPFERITRRFASEMIEEDRPTDE
jgi:hypothetical protein